jgi:peroxiredoxin Q/BCP
MDERKAQAMTALTSGDMAPAFDLPTDGGGSVSLSDFKGKTLILYFYPKDDTEACTKEALAFHGLGAKFRAAGAVVLGVSPDNPKRHDRFKAKHGLSLRLASDEAQAAANAYGVWVEKSMYGRSFMGVERATFLIAGDGRIRRVWRKVKVEGHAEEVLEAARAA